MPEILSWPKVWRQQKVHEIKAWLMRGQRGFVNGRLRHRLCKLQDAAGEQSQKTHEYQLPLDRRTLGIPSCQWNKIDLSFCTRFVKGLMYSLLLISLFSILAFDERY